MVFVNIRSSRNLLLISQLIYVPAAQRTAFTMWVIGLEEDMRRLTFHKLCLGKDISRRLPVTFLLRFFWLKCIHLSIPNSKGYWRV